VKDLLRLADLASEDLLLLCRLMLEFQSEPERHSWSMQDGVILCWFSVSTDSVADSVSTAGARLGGRAVFLDPFELRPKRVGSLENAARVLSSLGQLIVVGGLDDGDVSQFAAAASVPVVNGFTEGNNPCEALAELATLESTFGSLNGFRLAYVGRACNVTSDLMAAAALAGITLAVATPDGYQPSPVATAQARDIAEDNGESLRLTREPRQAVRDADGIVLGPLPPSWRHLTPDLLAGASPDAILLSCLPSADALGWPVEARRLSRAHQEQHRPRAYQAVFCALLEGLIEGRAPNAEDPLGATNAASG
jgi:ornithine carbamoyltransferase